MNCTAKLRSAAVSRDFRASSKQEPPATTSPLWGGHQGVVAPQVNGETSDTDQDEDPYFLAESAMVAIMVPA